MENWLIVTRRMQPLMKSDNLPTKCGNGVSKSIFGGLTCQTNKEHLAHLGEKSRINLNPLKIICHATEISAASPGQVAGTSAGI